MATFKDAKDREWDVRIDAPAIIAVRDECDPKFMQDTKDENTYTRLAGDPVLLCRVIFVLCGEQRATKNVSEADFYASLAGDAIDAATDALLKAIVSFTPKRSRELLEVSAAKTAKIRQIATDRALAKISEPELEEKLLTMIDAEIDRLLAGVTVSKAATD